MPGILDGVNDIIDKALGLDFKAKTPLYGHKTACQRLTSESPRDFDGRLLIETIYGQIENSDRREKSPSKQNWRWYPNPKIDPENDSPEVRLERAIVALPGNGWANQIPTASGLVNEHLDKTRNIDLVHWCKDGWYEFLELKVESNTPLFAAMEILQYGILYIFSRAYRVALGYRPHENPLLYGEGVHLKVLAPEDYYKDRGELYKLEWLEKKINDGLQVFLSEPKWGFDMRFSFESFRDKEDLLKNPAKNRSRVYPMSS
ncbi:MAG: hypothetical protein CAF45_016665 [Nitrospira sp. CG24E]|nr:MAG: hypothetical protein CAF45_016665 [Nitrospira sp. CG24E]